MTFHPFGPDHWAVLMFMAAAGLMLMLRAKQIRNVRDDRPLRFILALLLLTNEIGSLIFHISQGVLLLPLHLCDFALLLLVWSLLTRNAWTGELAFFWGLAGSLQAVLTPDLREGFPSFPWASFFLGHCGIVLGVIYLLVRGYAKVTVASVWRAWFFTNLYALIAGFANWGLGTNFGYLARKPEHPSLLDYLGPWPYYILWGELIALGLFFLCCLFGRKLEKLASRIL